jgi:zinc protease
LASVKRVTPEDLRRVAGQYLRAENRSVYALMPTGTAPRPASAVELTKDHAVQKFDLANGLRLLVKEDHRLPFVEFRSVFAGGVLAENAENSGITQMMGKLLLKGTKTRSAEEIAREIESVGGSIDSYGGNNSFGVNAEVLNADFDKGLELLADVLLNPAFSPTALEREREVQLAGIRSQRDNLLQSASKAMRRELFGSSRLRVRRAWIGSEVCKAAGRGSERVSHAVCGTE